MSKKAGRPKKYKLDLDQKEQILSLIKDYNINHNPYPTIKYKHIWEYSLKLNDQNIFPYKTSYDFWKRKDRLGRQLVDIVNSIEQKKVYISKSNNIDLIDIKELINKYGGKNKDILWDYLEPYDRHINSFIDKIGNIEEKNQKIVKQLDQQNDTIQNLTEKNEKLQKLVFSMFINSNKENELINLMNTGQSKSTIINIALEETFETPHSFINELTKQLHSSTMLINDNIQSNSNVVNLNRKKYKDPEYDL